MTTVFEDWMKSEYITIDSDGWHCSEYAPDDIKKKFSDFLKRVKTDSVIIEPES